MREFLVERFGARPFRSRFAVTAMDEFHHLLERCAGKKNLVDAFASHHRSVGLSDGAAATTENLDVVRAFLSQKIDNGCEKFDVPAVITRDADSAHVLLNRRPHDVVGPSDDSRGKSLRSRAG